MTMLEFDPDAPFAITEGSNAWRMPGALANFLAQHNDPESAAAKLMSDLDSADPLHDLFRFDTGETAQAFLSAYRNRTYRGKGDTPKWGPKVAVRGLHAGEDLMRTVLKVAEYCSVMLELDRVPEHERKATENLMTVARDYARKIRITTRRLFAPGVDTLKRFDKGIPREAEVAVQAHFVKNDNAAVLRVPMHIGKIAHIEAPAGLVVDPPPPGFWVEIAKADLRNDLEGKGPLVLMDLYELAELYELALERRRTGDRSTTEYGAWKSLVSRIKDDYEQHLTALQGELDDNTA